MSTQEFEGLVAVVSGGASGIGAAVADELAARGARVAALDITPDPASPHRQVSCDVTDTASVQAAVAEVAEAMGGIDVVVANAGIGAQGDVAANDDAEWARVLDLNVVGMARLVAAALPWLRRSPAAAVVTTSSIAATAGLPQRVLYSAAKGAVSAMTRAMAADHVREGIRFNSVNPGTADTPWIGRLLDRAPDPAAERAALEARQPHGRLVAAAEVARAVAYLASPLNASTTGIELAVDGGMQNLRLRPPGQ